LVVVGPAGPTTTNSTAVTKLEDEGHNLHKPRAMKRSSCVITQLHRAYVTVLCATGRFGIASSYFFEDDDDDNDDDNTTTLTPAS